MNYIIFIDKQTNDINSIGTTNNIDTVVETPTYTFLEVDETLYNNIKANREGAYIDNGIVVLKPLRHSMYEDWDSNTKIWVLNTARQLLGETDNVRGLRDTLLIEMDVIISNPIRWASMTPEKQAEWVQYRQLLLDIPQQAGFPLDVIYPTPPN
jgi:hypothetical protein